MNYLRETAEIALRIFLIILAVCVPVTTSLVVYQIMKDRDWVCPNWTYKP